MGAAGGGRSPAWGRAVAELWLGAAAAAFVGLFVNALHLTTPLFMAQVYDRVIVSRSRETLAALIGLALAAILFQAALEYLRGRMLLVVAARFAARLGGPVFEAAVEGTLSRGAAISGGLIRDLGELRAFIAGGAVVLPLDLAVAPLFLGVLWLFHPAYAEFAVIAVLLLAATALAAELLARRPSAKAAAEGARVQAETAAALRHAEAIVALGMLPALARRWRRAHARALDGLDGRQAMAKALSAVAKGLRIALQIGVVSVGAVLAMEHAVSPGTIIAAAVMMGRLLAPFEQMIDGWRQWVEALAAFARLRAAFEAEGSGRATEPVPIESGRLAADRVSFAPAEADAPVLRNISFSLEGGELLGVVGPSGAGKSTLARLIAGVWAPTTGGVYLDGQNVRRHEPTSFGAAVGYLPQEPMLFDATVRENIARFGDGDVAEAVRAARLAGVHDLIGALPRGYETRLVDGGARLSGGQRQRIALARALYGDPKLLVLDEPNSSLDAEGEAALVEAIETARRRGAAVVVVAQRMSILKRADRLLVIRDGAVSAYGDRSEVIGLLEPRPRPTRPGRLSVASAR